jgi:calcineurin-like phosphoesterase family protein
MATWFTSDLHFGHTNIIEYCGRPYTSVSAMNTGLIELWNANVSSADTVWVLGDVAMGHIADTLPLVRELHGRKILVTGNHDRCWPGHGDRSIDWIDRYLDAGFDEIRHGSVDLTIGGHNVLACHFPYRGDSQDLDRYLDARPIDRGAWLLHGHVHERWRQHDRMINVGVDAWQCAPVGEAAIAALIDAGPHDVPTL